MRKELELMEIIDNYIKGKLSETDKIAFEKKINENPQLKKEVELQIELLKGIERAGLKQSATQGLKKHKFKKGLKTLGLTGLAVAVIALGSVFVYNSIVKNNHKENAANELPELNEQGEKLWSDADKYLTPQTFELDAEKDTVVETKDGIVIAIPANSFLDANGNPAKGKIDLEVKEALNAADIMKAGLNTKSGDQLLETGGMFYVNARQDGASLKIDPKNPLYAEIPTNEVIPGMQLFEGKRLANGSIDWINPKPIQKDLIPVDILSLNFYPPNYLDSLKRWGYDTKDKKFTDSLYYSFASIFGGFHSESEIMESQKANSKLEKTGEKLFSQNCSACHSIGRDKITANGLEGIMERVPNENWLKKFIKNSNELMKNKDPYAVELTKSVSEIGMPAYTDLKEEELTAIIDYLKHPYHQFEEHHSEEKINGINPAKIKTIWDKKFQNTLLSTREFEERLPYIFSTCNEGILDLYLNNIDKNLCTIDSMAGGWETLESSKFREFAARGDGKVKNGNTNVRLLKAYYEQKTKLYTEAITKTQNEFWDKQNKKDKEAENERDEHDVNEARRIGDNFRKEFDLNLTEAYLQIGKEKPKAQPSVPGKIYGTSIPSTGWNNLDKFVLESTINRTTLDYTDPETGKKAIIKYEPLSISINDSKNYDRVLVYLLPDELNSFMRVTNKNEVFEEKLNELMIYKMVCIAYKGEESFYFSQDNVKPGTLNVSLINTSNADIQNNVNKLGKRSQIKAMNDELRYMEFEKEEAKRQVFLAKIGELTKKIKPVIFPCMDNPVADTIASPAEHWH
jgi:mono/diheme cytochrome c family protein